MQRSEGKLDVFYTTQSEAEMQLTKMILKYLGLDDAAGASSGGWTFALNKRDAIRFEKESREWMAASAAICKSFIR